MADHTTDLTPNLIAEHLRWQNGGKIMTSGFDFKENRTEVDVGGQHYHQNAQQTDGLLLFESDTKQLFQFDSAAKTGVLFNPAPKELSKKQSTVYNTMIAAALEIGLRSAGLSSADLPPETIRQLTVQAIQILNFAPEQKLDSLATTLAAEISNIVTINEALARDKLEEEERKRQKAEEVRLASLTEYANTLQPDTPNYDEAAMAVAIAALNLISKVVAQAEQGYLERRAARQATLRQELGKLQLTDQERAHDLLHTGPGLAILGTALQNKGVQLNPGWQSQVMVTASGGIQIGQTILQQSAVQQHYQTFQNNQLNSAITPADLRGTGRILITKIQEREDLRQLNETYGKSVVEAHSKINELSTCIMVTAQRQGIENPDLQVLKAMAAFTILVTQLEEHKAKLQEMETQQVKYQASYQSHTLQINLLSEIEQGFTLRPVPADKRSDRSSPSLPKKGGYVEHLASEGQGQGRIL